MQLHIITPVYKPANVPAIYHSIEESAREKDITWWMIFDKSCALDGQLWHEKVKRSNNQRLTIHCIISPIEDISGDTHRNYTLMRIAKSGSKGWFMFLPDTTILHPNLPKAFTEKSDWIPGILSVAFQEVNARGEVVPGRNLCFNTELLTDFTLDHASLMQMAPGLYINNPPLGYKNYLT